jgi:hypothetical protein
MKKILCSFLFAIALVTTFQISASALTIVPSTEQYAKTTYYQEYGTFYINSGTLEIRNDLNYGSRAVDTYGAGESFNYEYIAEVYDSNHNFTNRYAVYESRSGETRYVYFMTVDSSGRHAMANYTVY